MIRLKCTFLAQEWVGDETYPVHRENPPTWIAEVDELPEPFSYESGALIHNGSPPDWVLDWSGPFEVDYEELDEG